MVKPDRPVFCSNFEYDASEKEIVRLFERYGRVERIDMKTGFAFVYMSDKRDAEDAIKELDGREFGYKKRRLHCEFARQKMDDSSQKNLVPNKKLFVVNFDMLRTRERDLEDCFCRFGSLRRVQVKRNYAFIEFDTIDDAISAHKRMHGATFMGRTLTVEFVANNKAEEWGKPRDGSPPRRRSPPPARRRSPSPYGRRSSRSPGAAPRRRSPSPRERSPVPERRRPSPPRSRSPVAERRRASPPRSRSPVRERLPPRSRSRSPVRSPMAVEDEGAPARRRRSYSRSP